jgi:hypothetical protein
MVWERHEAGMGEVEYRIFRKALRKVIDWMIYVQTGVQY